MKRFVGIDLGKKTLQAVALCDDQKPEWFKTTTEAADLEKLKAWLMDGDTIAIEAGNLSFRLAKFLQREKIHVIVLNPGELAAIYASLKKTDKEDALKLARLIQRIPEVELPTVSVPSDIEMERRALVTENELYKKNRTKLINRLHALLHNCGLSNITRTDLGKASNRKTFLTNLSIAAQKEATRLCSNISNLEESLAEITDQIKAELQNEKHYAQLAMSMPGVGELATFTLLAFLGDCKRFKHGGQVAYYAGMVPRISISGNKSHYGRIIKVGCRQIKRIILQCAWGLIGSTHGGPIKKFYDRLFERLGKKKAAVAVGRKMLETFYSMMRSGELYRDVPDSYYNAKLRRYGLI